jgi:hypothetical protein
MTNFAPVQLSDWSKVNALFDDTANATDRARLAVAQNIAATGTQDLADRATLRGLAAGLNPSHTDPSAIGTALSVPIGTGSVNSLTEYNKGQLAYGGLPVMPYGTGGAVNSLSAGAPAISGGFEGAMGQAEGPGWDAMNKGGYSGRFQFGAERLADPAIGVYKPADGENLKKNEWRGTFNIPSHPEVRTHADFLKSPEAQRAVFGAHVADIDSAIDSLPGAQQLDRNGLRGVAQLGGVGGMRKWVATGGQYNPADANGTRLSDYYTKFAKGGAAALQQAFGHPDGPYVPPRPVQVASAAPATVNDASGAAGVAPAGTVAPASAQNVRALLEGYRPYAAPEAHVAVDPSYNEARNAPAKAPGSVVADTVPGATGHPAGDPQGIVPQAGLQPAAVPTQPAPQPVQAQAAARPVAATQQQAPSYGPTLDTWPPGTKAIQDRLGRLYHPQGTPEGLMHVQAPDGRTGLVRQQGYSPEVAFHPDQNGNMIAYDKGTGLPIAATQLPGKANVHVNRDGSTVVTNAQGDILRRDPSPNPAATGPYAGTNPEAQSMNILLSGDPSSPEYAAAYSHVGSEKVQADGTRVKPDMSSYRTPTWRPPASDARGGREYGTAGVTEPTKLTEGQANAAMYHDRMAKADEVINKVEKKLIEPAQHFAASIPGAGNYLVSPEYQRGEQAQRDFVNALLRRESGAAISQAEFDNARKQYFPQPGDKPETLRQKAENRATAIAGLRRASGPAATVAAPASAVDHLRANPNLRTAFDQKYGPGSAARVLGQ